MSQDTGNREPGYTPTDMQYMLEKARPSGWGEAIHWLQAEGMDDASLSPAGVQHMIEDIRCLEREDVGFTSDIEEAYLSAMEY